ncbi:MAG: hypothetical protein GWN71_41065, partial [Gammaproteobacteria bacterium]|nr:hypothetical protein [Gemmatimonadota bacterium]NIT88169.1 hypothetical protein [Gemmatimonadota bacterium]NIU79707.1 hypothetical protein [Gammaproteobacteria bacterium]
VEDSLEEFKEILLEELAPAEEPAAGKEAPAGREGTPLIYLICDAADEEAVEPLE